MVGLPYIQFRGFDGDCISIGREVSCSEWMLDGVLARMVKIYRIWQETILPMGPYPQKGRFKILNSILRNARRGMLFIKGNCRTIDYHEKHGGFLSYEGFAQYLNWVEPISPLPAMMWELSNGQGGKPRVYIFGYLEVRFVYGFWRTLIASHEKSQKKLLMRIV